MMTQEHTEGADEKGEESEGQEEVSEGRALKALRSPPPPTRREIEEHALSHIPFRAWCPHCMRGKARSGPRNRVKDKHEQEFSTVSLDYWFMGAGSTEAEQQEAEKKGQTPILVMHDSHTRADAIVCPEKGPEPLVVRKAVEILDLLGHKKVIMKGDQEPALIAFVNVLKAGWENGHVVPENSPMGDSRSNGGVERAIQTVEAQVRTIRDALEDRLGVKVLPDSPVMTWIVQHSAWLVRRCAVAEDGCTAYERIKGRRSQRPMAEIGEQVWYLPARTSANRRTNTDERVLEGTFLTVLDRSDEVVLADPEGNIIKAYQIRRKPEGQRWCADRVIGIKATTLQPTPGSNDLRIRTSINIERDTETKVQAPVPRGEERAPHRVRLMKYDFIQFGYTTGCPGCRALTQGRPAENHTEPCRSRMEAAIADAEHGQFRIQRAQGRAKRP